MDEWQTERGQLDEESGLFETITPFIGTEPRIYALIDGSNYDEVEIPEEFENPTIPPILEQEIFGFQVECAENFPVNPCTPDHKTQTADALTAAREAWVENRGFKEPRLQHTLVDVVIAEDESSFSALYKHDSLLSYHDSPNGGYIIEPAIGVTFFPSNAEHPVPDDVITRHEIFHAIQYHYEDLHENDDVLTHEVARERRPLQRCP